MEPYKIFTERNIAIMQDPVFWKLVANDYIFLHLHKFHKPENLKPICAKNTGLFYRLDSISELTQEESILSVLLITTALFMELFLRVGHADHELDLKEINFLSDREKYSTDEYLTDLTIKIIINMHNGEIKLTKSKSAHHASLNPFIKFAQLIHEMYEYRVFPNREILKQFIESFFQDLQLFNNSTAYSSGDGLLSMMSPTFNKSKVEKEAANLGVKEFVTILNQELHFEVIPNPKTYYI